MQSDLIQNYFASDVMQSDPIQNCFASDGV